MSKLKMTIKESIEDEETLIPEDSESKEKSIFLPNDDSVNFIASDELNELRDIILDIPDDIELLLLADKVVILATVEDMKTLVYTLPDEDAEDFILIDLPKGIQDILNNQSIIKYTAEGPDSKHEKVVDILMKKLNVDTEDNEEPEGEEDKSDEE